MSEEKKQKAKAFGSSCIVDLAMQGKLVEHDDAIESTPYSEPVWKGFNWSNVSDESMAAVKSMDAERKAAIDAMVRARDTLIDHRVRPETYIADPDRDERRKARLDDANKKLHQELLDRQFETMKHYNDRMTIENEQWSGQGLKSIEDRLSRIEELIKEMQRSRNDGK